MNLLLNGEHDLVLNCCLDLGSFLEQVRQLRVILADVLHAGPAVKFVPPPIDYIDIIQKIDMLLDLFEAAKHDLVIFLQMNQKIGLDCRLNLMLDLIQLLS